VFLENNSPPISYPPNFFQRPAFDSVPNAHIQSPPGYTNIDKIEKRINNNMEEMISANVKK